MENQTTINLIKERSEVPEYIQPLQNQFRNFSLLALIISVIAGVSTLAVFLSFQLYNQNLVGKKNSLNRRLEDLKPQESIYLTIKSRLPVVEKALNEGRPFSGIISLIMETQPPPKLTGIAYNEEGTVEFKIASVSLEESMEIVNKFLSPHIGVVISNPVMNSFTMSEKETSLTFSFNPIWEEADL
jgi:hypothetical protein